MLQIFYQYQRSVSHVAVLITQECSVHVLSTLQWYKYLLNASEWVSIFKNLLEECAPIRPICPYTPTRTFGVSSPNSKSCIYDLLCTKYTYILQSTLLTFIILHTYLFLMHTTHRRIHPSLCIHNAYNITLPMHTPYPPF